MLTGNSDVIFLKELLLTDINHHILTYISKEFIYVHVSAIRKANNFIGRSSVGIAILWRKMINIKLYAVYRSHRIMGLKLERNQNTYLIIKIYCMCDYGIEYKSISSDLSIFYYLSIIQFFLLDILTVSRVDTTISQKVVLYL